MISDVVERARRWWLTAWKVGRSGTGTLSAGAGDAGVTPSSGTETDDGKSPGPTLRRRLILTIDQLRLL